MYGIYTVENLIKYTQGCSYGVRACIYTNMNIPGQGQLGSSAHALAMPVQCVCIHHVFSVRMHSPSPFGARELT